MLKEAERKGGVGMEAQDTEMQLLTLVAGPFPMSCHMSYGKGHKPRNAGGF